MNVYGALYTVPVHNEVCIIWEIKRISWCKEQDHVCQLTVRPTRPSRCTFCMQNNLCSSLLVGARYRWDISVWLVMDNNNRLWWSKVLLCDLSRLYKEVDWCCVLVCERSPLMVCFAYEVFFRNIVLNGFSWTMIAGTVKHAQAYHVCKTNDF